jgi:hypothetical protein
MPQRLHEARTTSDPPYFLRRLGEQDEPPTAGGADIAGPWPWSTQCRRIFSIGLPLASSSTSLSK